MDVAEMLTNSKWSILKYLGKGEAAASQIARATSSSLANISQQTKLLEAYGYVKVAKEQKAGIGKPKHLYRLAKELGYVVVIRPGSVAKRTVKLDAHHHALFNILLYERAEDHYYLQKFLWQYESFIRQCQGIAIVDSNHGELHLLIVAKEKKLEKLRKKYSKIVIDSPENGEKAIICWTHSVEEITTGLSKKEEYFTRLLKHPHIIIGEVFSKFT